MRTAQSYIGALPLLLISLSRPTTAQLVGCDVVACPNGNSNEPECAIGNITASELGIASLNSTISPQPLTWTVAGSTIYDSTNSSEVLLTKSFYLGTPPSLDLNSSESFSGCALFFEGMTTILRFNGTDQDTAVGTCGDAMGSQCVTDLLSQAKSKLSSFAGNSGVNSSVCAQLQSALEDSAPKTCTNATGGSWGVIVSKDLTGQGAGPEVPQGSCHPTTGPNYDLSLVESYSFASESEAGLISPWVSGVTPVMTVFSSDGSSSNSVPGSSSQPDVQLTCLKTVGIDSSPTLVKGGATSLRLQHGILLIAAFTTSFFLY